MDPLHGPGPWTPYFFNFFFNCYFSFLAFFLFSICLYFLSKKINHTKPNHSDWVHGHSIFHLVGDERLLTQWDKMSLLMIGIIKVTGLHDSYVREICTLAVLCPVFRL